MNRVRLTHRRGRCAWAALAALVGLACCTGGCAREERVIYQQPRLLEGVAGVQEGGEDLAAKKKREADAKKQRQEIAKATGEPKAAGESEPGARDEEALSGSRVSSAMLDQTALDEDEAAIAAGAAAMARAGGQESGGLRGSPAGAEAKPDDPLVERGPKDAITLKAGSNRDVIALLSRVVNGDEEIQAAFYEQVVSSATKDHLRSQGDESPEAFYRFLRTNRTPINHLLARLPAGEGSPGVIVTVAGKNQFRLEVTGSASRGLKFTELWTALDPTAPAGRQWRFVWVR